MPWFFDNADLWALRVTMVPANAVETILFSCWGLATVEWEWMCYGYGGVSGACGSKVLDKKSENYIININIMKLIQIKYK